MADWLFTRDPSALPLHCVRIVREQLPGYRVQRRPVTADILERFLAGESIADLTHVYTLPTPEVETIVRHEWAVRRHAQPQ
jgi:Mor family transcriptional regulator